MGQILTHHVLKAFDDDGTERMVGECVNALGWRLGRQLESLRYIQLLPEGLEPVADSEGRYWTGPEWLTRYGREPLQAVMQETADDDPASEIVFEESNPVPTVEKLPGIGLWRLPDGTKFRGSKLKAEEMAAQMLAGVQE